MLVELPEDEQKGQSRLLSKVHIPQNTKHFRLPARGIKVIHEQNDR